MSGAPAPSLGIRLEGVRKSFGSQVALAGVDLDISQGSSVAVMGPNGAGKTTMLKVIAGLVSPTAGSVRVADVEMRRAGPGLRRLVGFASHESMLYPDLSVEDNLLFYARLFGLPRPREAVEEMSVRLDFPHILRKTVRTLSRGTRQRVALARALIHSPAVLLMDEPYTGLDEAAAASLADLLRRLHTPDRILVVCVHEIFRAMAGAERLVVLNGGRIALDRPLAGDEEEIASTYLALLRSAEGVPA